VTHEDFPSAADVVVTVMARQIEDGTVVATGAASPLAILAVAVAKATHAPRLTYLACIGAIDPAVSRLRGSSEDTAYLEGQCGAFTIPDLFDHARRGRIDVMFFGAAEVDGTGLTNLTGTGSLERPETKFPGVAGAATLRRWVHRPVLVVGRQNRRNLVERVQVASTSDPGRPTPLITDLGVFELCAGGATLIARHPRSCVEEIHQRTAFAFEAASPLPVTPEPSREHLSAIQSLDPQRIRDQLVG
jgi:glutaconate CoA-transferase subunit B